MNCYKSKRAVKIMDLLVSELNEFDLTKDRVYVAIGTDYGTLVQVENDKGIEEWYSTEYFRFYEGEKIDLVSN